MSILGLHHITLVCSDAQQTIDFYTRVLGLRLVKLTVNFDDPSAYHLYFGDETGSPGSAVTFFEWRGAPRGNWGIGGTHHFALIVPTYEGLLKWKRRLNDLGIAVEGPLDRHYFTSIYFNDPDGTIIEIAMQGPGFARDEDADKLGTTFLAPPADMLVRNRDEEKIRATTWGEPIAEITPDMALSNGMHHITAISSNINHTQEFFGDLLGMRRVKMTGIACDSMNFDDPTQAHWYWGVGDGKPGTLITYFERDAKKERRAKFGAGQTHHYALAVADEQTQLEWREKLVRAGLRVSPVMDRIYFKSIYTNDPDGHIVELATRGPGFLMDEDVKELGTHLKLPSWLEKQRGEIQSVLRPVQALEWKSYRA